MNGHHWAPCRWYREEVPLEPPSSQCIPQPIHPSPGPSHRRSPTSSPEHPAFEEAGPSTPAPSAEDDKDKRMENVGSSSSGETLSIKGAMKNKGNGKGKGHVD